MKNKDEYMQSIFAKRDALLAKRKRNIRIAVSSLGIAICICTAFTAKGYLDKADEIYTDTDGKATPTTVTCPAIEYLTFESSYEKPTHSASDATADSTELAASPNLFGNSEEYLDGVPEIEIEGSGGEDLKSPETDGEAADASPEEPHDSSIEEQPSENAIIEEAKKYLTKSEYASVDIQDINVTVSRKSTGETEYTVHFKTADKKIKITLNADTLEFIERKESDADAGEIRTTPAYNPNA